MTKRKIDDIEASNLEVGTVASTISTLPFDEKMQEVEYAPKIEKILDSDVQTIALKEKEFKSADEKLKSRDKKLHLEAVATFLNYPEHYQKIIPIILKYQFSDGFYGLFEKMFTENAESLLDALDKNLERKEIEHEREYLSDNQMYRLFEKNFPKIKPYKFLNNYLIKLLFSGLEYESHYLHNQSCQRSEAAYALSQFKELEYLSPVLDHCCRGQVRVVSDDKRYIKKLRAALNQFYQLSSKHFIKTIATFLQKNYSEKDNYISRITEVLSHQLLSKELEVLLTEIHSIPVAEEILIKITERRYDLSDEPTVEQGEIYVKKDKDSLKYAIVADGKEKLGEITKDEFHKHIKGGIPESLNIRALEPLSTRILKIVSEKGDIQIDYWKQGFIKYVKDKESKPQFRELLRTVLEKKGVIIFGNLNPHEKEFKPEKIVVVDLQESQVEMHAAYRTFEKCNFTEIEKPFVEEVNRYNYNKLIAQFVFFLTYKIKDIKKRDFIRVPIKIAGVNIFVVNQLLSFLSCKNRHSEVALLHALISNKDGLLDDIRKKILQNLEKKDPLNVSSSSIDEVKFSIKLKAVILQIYSSFAACKDCWQLITKHLFENVILRQLIPFGYSTPERSEGDEMKDKGIGISVFYSHKNGNLGGTISRGGHDYSYKGEFDDTNRKARRAFYSNHLFQQVKDESGSIDTDEIKLAPDQEYTFFISNR